MLLENCYNRCCQMTVCNFVKGRNLKVASQMEQHERPRSLNFWSGRREKERDGTPVMADELKPSTSEAIHGATSAMLVAGGPRDPVIILLDPNEVDLQDIGRGHDEVGDGTDSPLGGPLRRVEVVGLGRGNLRGWRVGRGVGDEPRGAVLDARRPVHHLERRVAHLGPTRVFL